MSHNLKIISFARSVQSGSELAPDPGPGPASVLGSQGQCNLRGATRQWSLNYVLLTSSLAAAISVSTQSPLQGYGGLNALNAIVLVLLTEVEGVAAEACSQQPGERTEDAAQRTESTGILLF